MPNGGTDPPDVSPLRLEIVEAQKSRTDLMKYKLVVAAALAAVAVGVGPAAAAEQIPYVVGIIPFVCLYVDAVCAHNDIRIIIIGRCLREHPTYRAYETVAHHLRPRYNLERVALDWSTLSVCGGLLVFGLGYALFAPDADGTLVCITTLSGAAGLVLTLALQRKHRRIMAEVSTLDIDELLSPPPKP